MKHLCKNFIENGKCVKCGTPEWAVYFPEFIHVIGSKVIVPKDYYKLDGVFIVLKKSKHGYTIGKDKNSPTEFFNWWELYPKKEVKKQ